MERQVLGLGDWETNQMLTTKTTNHLLIYSTSDVYYAFIILSEYLATLYVMQTTIDSEIVDKFICYF